MFSRAKKQMQDIELPSVKEGFTKTFYVKDGQVEEYKSEISDGFSRGKGTSSRKW